MNNINILSVILLTAVIIILGISLSKLDKKEKYCVDISGGFKPPCDCNGYCDINS